MNEFGDIAWGMASAVFLAAYVVGATPFGFLVGKLKGIDIRKHGSGNIGATNVLRILGKPWGITVLVLDVIKGLAPVLAARGLDDGAGIFPVAAALGAILGHNFTFWLKFRGGKGVATSAGAVLGVMPVAVLIAAAVWFALYFGTRYVAVASIGAAAAIPIAVGLRLALADDIPNWPTFALACIIFLLVVVRHRSNIRRLRAGTEHKFDRRKKNHPAGSERGPLPGLDDDEPDA